ncbi:MAG: DUF11 domain-containing protein, partial [Mycobacterium sp.]|nr:DUF11 domain-containing protein [Mycobacterium sp.]
MTKTSNGPWTINQTGATYTLTVSNTGAAATVGTVTASDALPNGITPQWTGTLSTGSWNCTFSAQAVTCTATPNLAAVTGTSTITLPVNVTPATPTGSNSITNYASVGGGGDPFNGGSAPTPGSGCSDAMHCASVQTSVTPLADLSITKVDNRGGSSITASIGNVIPGTSVTYTIVVSNAGPNTATGAAVADTLPTGITSDTWTAVASGGATGFSASGSGNINDTVNMPSGSTITYTVTASVSASATGTLNNTATVAGAGGTTDPNPGNNSATDVDTLTPQADLSITKTDGVTTAIPGSAVTYTIVASNAGPSAANGATVADNLPASITSATWICAGTGGGTCTASGSGNINDTVNLPSGASVTYTVTASISASATGTLSNTATVSAPAGVTDPNPGNNSATDTDTLSPQADLSITKSDGTGSYSPGGTTTYTIVVGNAGPSAVAGATIADIMPASISSDSWSAVGTGGASGFSAAGSGNISDTVNLPVGSTITYTVNANISLAATGNLVNTATVAVPGGVNDPNPANNSATDTDSNGGAAQLTIAKSATPSAFAVGQSGTYS